MEKRKSPLSIRLIFWLTNFVMGLLLLVSVLVVTFNVLLYTDFFGNNMQLHIDLPVEVDIKERGTLYINNSELAVELVETLPRIHFVDTPNFITRPFALVSFVMLLMGVFLTWTFRSFIKNVKNGNVFTLINIKLIKCFAYGLATMWLITIIYTRILYHYIAKNLEFEQVVVTDKIPNYPGVLMMALFIWVLAHIFMTGLKLQEEKDLTI